MHAGLAPRAWATLALLAALLCGAACGSTPSAVPAAVEPTQLPTQAGIGAATQPAPATSTQAPFPSARPSTARGRGVYTANCAACHGATGDGSGSPGGADFTDVELMARKSPADLYVVVRDGKQNTDMPAWGTKLREMGIWDVVYYSLSLIASPVQISLGSGLFQTHCTPCHGQQRDAPAQAGAANLTDPKPMAGTSLESLAEMITNGVPASSMPAFGETLSQDQVWMLVNYVRSLSYDS